MRTSRRLFCFEFFELLLLVFDGEELNSNVVVAVVFVSTIYSQHCAESVLIACKTFSLRRVDIHNAKYFCVWNAGEKQNCLLACILWWWMRCSELMQMNFLFALHINIRVIVLLSRVKPHHPLELCNRVEFPKVKCKKYGLFQEFGQCSA